MKRYIITLDAASRYARSAFGKFTYMAEHGRLVWQGKAFGDIAELAAAVTDASKFLRSYTGPLSHMSVAEVEEEEKAEGGNLKPESEVTGGQSAAASHSSFKSQPSSLEKPRRRKDHGNQD